MNEKGRTLGAARRGPHEDRELELMLAGKKPLAVFYDTVPECGIIPEREFAPHVDSGKVVMSERIFHSSPRNGTDAAPSVRVVFYARPEEAWRIDEAKNLMEEVLFERGRPNDEDDARLGRLLGYTDAEIKEFLVS